MSSHVEAQRPTRTPSAETKKVVVRNLNFYYGQTRALKGVSFKAKTGQRIAIVGPLAALAARFGVEIAEAAALRWDRAPALGCACAPLSRAFGAHTLAEAIRIAAENIPGVKKVEDHLIWIEPNTGVIIEPPKG